MGLRRFAMSFGAGALLAGLGFLVSRGRIQLDLGWGRTRHRLGPIVETIDAPRELVFEHVSTPYLGRAPAEVRDRIVVLERGEGAVVAEHRTPLPWLDALTVERVRFFPPERITFSLLRGPVPEVTEEFILEETDGGGTRFTYRGELAADLWWVGRWWGGRVVAPTWEAVVADSMAGIKAASEARAASRRRRGSGRDGRTDQG